MNQIVPRKGNAVADRTINRMMAHLKTFASFVHEHAQLPLGHPTENENQSAARERAFLFPLVRDSHPPASLWRVIRS